MTLPPNIKRRISAAPRPVSLHCTGDVYSLVFPSIAYQDGGAARPARQNDHTAAAGVVINDRCHPEDPSGAVRKGTGERFTSIPTITVQFVYHPLPPGALGKGGGGYNMGKSRNCMHTPHLPRHGKPFEG